MGNVRGQKDASGLSGAAYSRRSRTIPTADGGVSGRWVAADESGWNGEDLYRPEEPYLVVGSVAVDDVDARALLAGLRADARIAQAGEVKFSHFATRARRLEVLVSALDPAGGLGERAGIHLVDKRFFIVGKIVDLLLEEYVHARGGDLYANDQARKLAWRLFAEGPRALGPQLFDQLVGVFLEFARFRNRGQPRVINELFRVLELAERRSTRRRVSDILAVLVRCRREAMRLHRLMSTETFTEAMEPLITVPAAVLDWWSRRLGPASLLFDAHKVLTDERLDTTLKLMTDPFSEFRFVWQGSHPPELVRGYSADHPSIQLADLVAGAGRAVAHWHEGLASRPEIGEALAPAVGPLIWKESLIPHDEPQQYMVRRRDHDG